MSKDKTADPVMVATQALAKTLGFKTMKDDINSEIRDTFSTGCKPFDIMLGNKGAPGGRLIELFGKPSEGKSTTALELTKAFTSYCKRKKKEYYVLWIESESVFDRMRAHYVGCDLKRFLITEVSTVEEGFDSIDKTIDAAKAGGFMLFVVWDTIAATVTKAQKTSNTLFSGGIAEKPRLIYQALRGLIPKMGEVGVTVVLVNQLYSLIGGNGGHESPGGYGIKFFSSIRCTVKVVERVFADDGATLVAIMSELETIKNKVTVPRQKIRLYLNCEKGFDSFHTLYNFCVENKLIDIKGSWKYVHLPNIDGTVEDITFQSAQQLREKMKSNPIILDYLEYQVVKTKAASSPFMKVLLIEELWDFETTFHGSPQTSLSPDEVELARLEEIEILKQDTVEDPVEPPVGLSTDPPITGDSPPPSSETEPVTA